MINRTIKIISLTVLVASVIFFVILAFRSSNREIALQKDSKKNEFSLPSLPSNQGIENMSISDARSAQEIRNAYQQFSKGKSIESKEAGFVEMKIAGPSQEMVPLNLFLNAVDAKVDEKIEKFVRQDNFSPFFCSIGGKKDYGLILNVGRFKTEEEVDYQKLPDQVIEGIEKWNTILKDLQPVLFPEVNFSELQLSQKIDFKQGKYLYADIMLPGGEKKSINYASMGDPMVFTTSLECMDIATEKIADDTEQ